MPLSKKLDRTLRPVEDESDNESYYEVTDRSSPSIIDTGDGADVASSSADDDAGFDDGEAMSGASDPDQVEKRLSKVSFGALAKAQDQISQQQASRKRKRGDGTSGAQEDKLQALRERLREIKAQKQATDAKPSKQSKPSAKAHQARKEEKKHDDDIEDEDADEGSDSDAAPHARSSKHAPAVQSSKRAVTRRRNVVETKQAKSRDPRFDNISGTKPDENLLQKRYGFLDDYKASEMAELKAAIRKTKNEEDKEKLKRKLLSMESQKKAKDAKEKQQEIAQEHKKKERELIKQGKNPFYLKKGEQKKLALVDRFQNMKSKQRDKVMERRRKKVASKERKNMPAERRGA